MLNANMWQEQFYLLHADDRQESNQLQLVEMKLNRVVNHFPYVAGRKVPTDTFSACDIFESYDIYQLIQWKKGTGRDCIT